MLLEFGLKNFFCFKEGVSISFELDANCPTSVSMGRDFTTVLGLKGANGSGKTHVLKGLAFLANFCTNSFASKPDETIAISSFFRNEEPSELYAKLRVGDTTYLYEVSLTEKKVVRETIYRKKDAKGRKVKIVERRDDTLSVVGKEFAKLRAMKLRTNASLISTVHQYGFDLLDDLYSSFESTISNVSYSGLAEIPHKINVIAEFLNERKPTFDFVKGFISSCDTGISNIDIVEVKNEQGEEVRVPVFVHKVDGKEKAVTEYTESSGTKALFRNLPSYHLVLATGGLLIMDEFDTHLHPHILPKLIELFLDPKINERDAQIIFSSHDAEILNVLGRYRTYLVNKVENESFAYRLDEIPGDVLRNDRPILPAYNDGKIGGIPRL